METIGRFFTAPRDSYFLFGPRGTGKSTWLRENVADALTVDLLDPATFRTYLARPERLKDLLAGSPGKKRVVIDEVQKAPALLEVVHQVLEERGREAIQFILTGSSARKLKRSGVDLLAGRLLLRTMHPFMAAEMGPQFDPHRALRIGLIPLVVDSVSPEQTLQAYVDLYLREEVQAEALVRNIGDFSRFLEAVSLSHAGQLSVSDVSRECQVGRKTVEGFLQVLEDLLLAFHLQSFTRRARRQVVQHPKLYLADTGLFQALRPRGPLDSDSEVRGAALEGLVAQHLRAWIGYGVEPRELFFWRTRTGLEVDFVVYGPNVFAAIEVKASDIIHPKDLKGLTAFLEEYPEARGILLYGGRERLKTGAVECVPWVDFLKELRPYGTLGLPPHSTLSSLTGAKR